MIYPHNRQIFQRNSQNEATIALLGKCNQDLDLIQYKFEPVKKGQGTLIDWTSLNATPQGGYFQENVLVKGGWYTLKIRTYKNAKLIEIDVESIVDNFLKSKRCELMKDVYKYKLLNDLHNDISSV